jgi:hypothetical protein
MPPERTHERENSLNAATAATQRCAWRSGQPQHYTVSTGLVNYAWQGRMRTTHKERTQCRTARSK